MKVNNKNFKKNIKEILNLTHSAKYVSSLDEEDALNMTEIVWVKSLIDLGYSVTFKKEATNVSKIWTDEQGAIINKMQTDIASLQTDVAVLKTDVAVLKSDVAVLKSDVAELKEGMSLILKHLGIKK